VCRKGEFALTVSRALVRLLRDLFLGDREEREAGGFRSSFFRRGVCAMRDAERHTASTMATASSAGR